jgi:hypothetical protein
VLLVLATGAGATGRARTSYRLVGRAIAVIDRASDGNGHTFPTFNVYFRLNRPALHDPIEGTLGYAVLDRAPGGEGFFTIDLPGQRAHPCYDQGVDDSPSNPPALRAHRPGTRLPLVIVLTGRPPKRSIVARLTTTVRLQRDANQSDPLFYPRKLGCEKRA